MTKLQFIFTTLFLLTVFLCASPLFAEGIRDAGFYYNRGLANLENGEYGIAIENFTQALRMKNNAEYYNKRGEAYFYNDEYNRAFEDFSDAILLEPDNAEYYNNRGTIYYLKNELDPAIEDFSNAILLESDNAEYYNNRGYVYLEKCEYDLAIADFSQSILIDQDNAEYYNNRGYVYLEKCEYDLAIADFSQSILIDQDNAVYFNNRSYAYRDKSEYDLAIEDLSHAILLDPNDVIAYSNRGSAYNNKGEYDLAIEDLSQAILLDPNFTSAYNNRGSAYNNKGEYDLAIEDLSQAILLDPNFAESYNNRGFAYEQRGEYDLAIEDYSQAILLDHNFAMAYNNRGSAYNIKGEYDLALEDLSQAILLDPNFTSAYNNRGSAYNDKGEYDLAIEDYSHAILLDPNNVLAYNNRGVAYVDKGEYDLAIEDYSQAILLDPNHAGAYYNRAMLYYNKDEYDLAISDWKESLTVAEDNINLNEIFAFSIELVHHYYSFYTENESFAESLAYVVMDGISGSVRRTENVRSNLGARGSAIMTQALYFYYMGVDFESRFGSHEKAFEYSESLRSRGFLDQIGTEAALRLVGISEEERERTRYLLKEIENRQNVLNAFRTRPPQNKEEEKSFVSAGQMLTILEAEITSLDADISSRIPGYRDLRSPVPATLEQAKDWLADDTAVLIYVLWDESIDFKPIFTSFTTSIPRPPINSYCLILTKDGLKTVILDHDFNYLQAINRLRTIITGMERVGGMEMDRNDLYKTLIKPALVHIPDDVKKLIIVPDGTLGHLPFDILREDYDSPDFGEMYRLSLSPSVSVSMLSEKTSAQKLPIMAFGGAWYDSDKTAAERGTNRSAVYETETNHIAWRDLPGTEAEVKLLEQIVSSAENIRLFLGSDVSEEHVKRLSGEGELANYPILHFATHGYFKEEDLDRAGIVLSEVSGLLDNDEDGYLTIPEIAVLNLDAQMVLLSACETGLGLLKRGDGMVGMVRAFLIAGAKYLGVSLWEVNDETTLEFMTRLYGKVLNEGIDFKEAYYLVKNEFRHADDREDDDWDDDDWDYWEEAENQKELSHPNYWSAFVIYE